MARLSEHIFRVHRELQKHKTPKLYTQELKTRAYLELYYWKFHVQSQLNCKFNVRCNYKFLVKMLNIYQVR